MSFSVKLGNFLYKRAFFLYKPLYRAFKRNQDAFEIELLKKYVRPNDVVLDIGANIGFYASLLSGLVGDSGKVHCFEPDVTNFSYLRRQVGKLKNIVANNKAVGARTEKIKIYTSKELNVDHRTYKPEEYEREIEIDAISIDDYLKIHPKADLIKMDIQGFEMQAIQGMEKILAHNSNVKLISEFWPYGLKMAGSSATEYFNHLRSRGFKCYLLEKRSLKELTEEKVKSMESLGKEHYFNILASRQNV